MQIRLAEARDCIPIARMRADLWPSATEAEHAHELELELSGALLGPYPQTRFVAELETRLIGFIEVGMRSHVDGCDPRQPSGFIEGWYVVTNQRSRGVGQALMARAEAWAREQGCRELGSDTWITSEDSQRAHAAAGFEVVDRCVHFRKELAPSTPAHKPARSGFMEVSEAVRHRRSCRAFLPQPVDLSLLREAITLAARAPSGGNLQPWRLHVLTGDAMARFRKHMAVRLQQPEPDPMEYMVYPPQLHEPYRSQRFEVGEAMYALLDVSRDDKAGRLMQFARNWDFFGAPAGLFCFVDRRMGPPQWSDLGMYLQTLMLLLAERGLATCAQEAWSAFHQSVSSFVGAPAEHMLFCGMAIGYADPKAPVNTLQTARAPLEVFAKFHDE